MCLRVEQSSPRVECSLAHVSLETKDHLDHFVASWNIEHRTVKILKMLWAQPTWPSQLFVGLATYSYAHETALVP